MVIQPPAAQYQEWIAIGYEQLELNITVISRINNSQNIYASNGRKTFPKYDQQEKKKTNDWARKKRHQIRAHTTKIRGWIFIVFCHITATHICTVRRFFVLIFAGNAVSTFLSFVCYLFGFPFDSLELWEPKKKTKKKEEKTLTHNGTCRTKQILSVYHCHIFFWFILTYCLHWCACFIALKMLSCRISFFISFAVAVRWRSLVTDCIVECFFIEAIFVLGWYVTFCGWNSQNSRQQFTCCSLLKYIRFHMSNGCNLTMSFPEIVCASTELKCVHQQLILLMMWHAHIISN